MDKKLVKVMKEDQFVLVKDNYIKQILFSDYLKGFMISYGKSHDLRIWEPNPKRKSSFIQRLKGHSGEVVDVKTSNNSGEIFSLDKKLELRIWNVKLLQIM